MQVLESQLPGVLLIEPKALADERGYFMESFHSVRYEQWGIPPFVQDNVSFSGDGVLRGLHFQFPRAQGKPVQVLQGAVFDVAVDVRMGSASFGKWMGYELSAENRRQLWIPPGFAHGFCVTSKAALVMYKCTELYAPEDKHSLLWNDAIVGIRWPVDSPVLSEKDRCAPCLFAFPWGHLPAHEQENA